MALICRSRCKACVAVVLAGLLSRAIPADAQTFFELSGGWNYLAPPPAGDSYSRGFDVGASIGREVTSTVLLRLDAFASEFDHRLQVQRPFLTPDGPEYFYGARTAGVTGLAVNGLVNMDPRGMLYLIGGVGFYDTYGAKPSGPYKPSAGVSAGAGISVPVRSRLRAFAEARDHLLLGSGPSPPWIVPIAFGLRYCASCAK